MVVTRRTPIAPAPPTSRTNSSQPVSRAVKEKAQETSHDNHISSTLPNGESRGRSGKADIPSSSKDEQPNARSKGKTKHKKNKKRKRVTFLTFLNRLLLLAFAIYTLSVCPTDEKLESHICRGLSYYRRFVLDPYIVPPFTAALAHPSISSYIDRIRPHIDRAIHITTPILVRSRLELNSRVVPQWNKRIVPQWNKQAVPRIRRIQKHLEPYRTRMQQQYDKRLASHVRVAAYNLHKWQYQTQPYIILAAEKTHTGYQAAKPYAITILNRLTAFIKELVTLLQKQRRQFVDPHVARIWEKVKELSSGKPAIPTMVTSPESPVETGIPSSSPADQVSALIEDMDSTTTSSLSSSSIISTATDETIQSAISVVSETLAMSVSPTTSPGPVFVTESPVAPGLSTQPNEVETPPSATILSAPSNPAVETLESASSVASISAHGLSESLIVSPLREEITSSILSSTSSSPVIDSTEAALTVSPESVPTPDSQYDNDIDLEAFYAELGLDDSSTTGPESAEEIITPLPPQESEEEKQESRRREAQVTAEKRADIEGRNAKWESELATLIKGKKKELRKALVAVRKAAAAELKESPEIRAQIEVLVAEAEKYLKGAEVYMKKLQKEGRKDEEKITLWKRVVEKVELKFSERLTDTEGVVNSWYDAVLSKEMQEVRQAVAEVKDLAERAQVDIGLDYAWLDDVTYEDWQRYHNLMRTSENFTDQAMTIQNGSHPSPPINPVIPGIRDLESEVEDIVTGFETRLRRIKRTGERVFGYGSSQSSDEDVPEAPVSAEDGMAAEENTVPPVIIGRSQEEVLEALGKVEAHGETQETPPAGSSKQVAEEAVESLVREAEVEADVPSIPTAHNEL